MNTTIRQPARRQRVAAPMAVALVALFAVLVAVLAGRPGGNVAAGGASSPNTTSAVSGDGDRAAVEVELVVGDRVATARLDDTPAAREFAAMLPVSVQMDDPFGQAKTGPLPRALDVDDATRSRRYAAGDLSYWSPSGTLAVVYDALGQSVPPPGLVRLGSVDAGLAAIASAGKDFSMTIRRAR